jgi:phage terminase large subunit
MKNPEIAALLIANQEIVGRAMTTAESAEPKSIDEIRDNGYDTIEPATKGKDSVNNGIQRLQALDIYYTARSHHIEEEMLNYSWKIDKEDKSLNIPIDAYNHAIDAIRYRIMAIEMFKEIEYGGVR